jgi:hypothetical protein
LLTVRSEDVSDQRRPEHMLPPIRRMSRDLLGVNASPDRNRGIVQHFRRDGAERTCFPSPCYQDSSFSRTRRIHSKCV